MCAPRSPAPPGSPLLFAGSAPKWKSWGSTIQSCSYAASHMPDLTQQAAALSSPLASSTARRFVDGVEPDIDLTPPK